jgi:hypothetical protein
MANAGAPGIHRIVIRSTKLNQSMTVMELPSGIIGQGGATLKAPTNSQEKWYSLGIVRPRGAVAFGPGCVIEVWHYSTAGVTLDTTKCIISLPYFDQTGSSRILTESNADMNEQNLANTVIPAGVWTLVCAKRLKEGESMIFGGGKAFMDLSA